MRRWSAAKEGFGDRLSSVQPATGDGPMRRAGAGILAGARRRGGAHLVERVGPGVAAGDVEEGQEGAVEDGEVVGRHAAEEHHPHHRRCAAGRRARRFEAGWVETGQNGDGDGQSAGRKGIGLRAATGLGSVENCSSVLLRVNSN